MIAGSMDSIVMVEGEMHEVSEEEMVSAIEAAHAAIKVQCQVQLDMAAEVPGSSPKREYEHEKHDDSLKQAIHDACYQAYYDAAKNAGSKKERGATFKSIKEDFLAGMSDEDKAAKQYMLRDYFKATQKKAIRDLLLNEGIRLDGRGTKDIRPIWCEVDYLPGPHGSSVFTRGETQSLTTLTLGTKDDEQLIDNALVRKTEKFLLHYNFRPSPPVRPAPSAAPAAGRLATETSHFAPSSRCCRRWTMPVHHSSRQRDPPVQRIQLHGYRVRRYPRPDGRRRADQAPRERHRHGPDHRQGVRQVRRPERHPR